MTAVSHTMGLRQTDKLLGLFCATLHFELANSVVKLSCRDAAIPLLERGIEMSPMNTLPPLREHRANVSHMSSSGRRSLLAQPCCESAERLARPQRPTLGLAV